MFKIGDKIVYPMHGAGIIESIEEKEILGVKNKYYIMKISLDDMRVMIPINNIESLGIRKIIEDDEEHKITEIFKKSVFDMEKNWSKRYRQNEIAMRNGDVFEIAEIVRNLMAADRAKKLSAGEKKILINARQLLVSELMLVWNVDREQAEVKLDKIADINS